MRRLVELLLLGLLAGMPTGAGAAPAIIAFPDAAVAPRTYEAALEAVNLPAGPRPDLVRRDSHEWHNLAGYFVKVIAAYPTLDHIDAIILSVHPLP